MCSMNTVPTLKRVSPFLRWAGSKRQLVPELAQFWNPTYKRYIEPFAGSACLYFHLVPKRAILGDINPELIKTYIEIRDNVGSVINALKGLRNAKSEYLRIRALPPEALSKPMKAARFIYLNRFCFNGLYRTNLRGRFNVPYGGQRSGSLPTSDSLQQCSKLLMGARLVAADFENVLEQVRPGDFVYMDPPYAVQGRRIFREYNPAAFGDEDLRRVRFWMCRLAKMGVAFVLTFADSAEAKMLQEGFHTRYTTVRRSISGFTGFRSRAREVLIFP